MALRGSFVLIVSAAAAATSACQSTETCNPPPVPVGVVIDAPEGVVVAVVGEGICDSPARCIPRGFGEPFTPGCEHYQLLARDVGRCVVNVRLTNGEVRRFETNIVRQEFCDTVSLVAEERKATTFVVTNVDAGAADATSD
jgi:hypothetical protein